MHKSRTTKLCTVAPNICGSSVWIMLHVTLLVPRIFRWLIDLKKHRTSMFYAYYNTKSLDEFMWYYYWVIRNRLRNGLDNQ